MSPAEGDSVYDQFDESPVPAAGGSAQAPQTIVQNGRPMSSVGTLPEPTEEDQQAAARGARESAARTPRQRAKPQGSDSAPKPATEGENPYDIFDKDPKDDGVALMERLRLNRQDAFYRGSVVGSARLTALASIYKTPDDPEMSPERKAVNQQMRDEYIKVVADLAAHDEMQPFGTTMEAMAALGGQLEGTMISPEAWIGWGAKGATWLGRTIRAGLQQGGIQVATDPVVQGLNIKAGVQNEYDPMRTILSGVLGFGIGGGAHVIGEGVGKIVGQLQLRKQLYDLGKENSSFDASRHAMWALDPNNGIGAEPRPEPQSFGPETGRATDAASAPAETVAPLSSAPLERKPISEFTTAKGSIYEVHENGTTTRDKAPRPEHPGEEGPQPQSQATFYVTPEDAVKLGEFQTQGTKKTIIRAPDGSWAAVGYLDGPSAGKLESRTRVDVQQDPAVGLVPVEIWKDGERVHFGNEITEVKKIEEGADTERTRTKGDEQAREIPEDGDLQAITQRRKGGAMAGEPVRGAVATLTPSPEKDIAIRSLQQQAMDLAEALDFPLREGRVGSRKAAGTFNLRSGVVRVREVPDFDVVSHEAGHAIESKIGADLTAFTQTHAAELRALDYDQGPTGRRVNEGFAEYVRLMMTNPAYATNTAPTFAMEFRQFMAARDPVMLAKIDQAALAYKAYLDAPSVDAVGSVRRSVDENPQGLPKVMAAIREDGLPAVIKSVMQKSYNGVLDHRAPIARVVRELGRAVREREGEAVDLLPSDNPERLARLVDRSRQSATRDLMDGVRPYHDITPDGPSLANAITEAAGDPSVWGRWNPEKKEQLSTYTIARRAEYLWRKFDAGEIPNPPVAFSRLDAIQAMTDLEAINPNLRNASDMVHEYTRQLLRKSFDGGLIDADLYNKLLLEEFYVPFNRDMSDKPGGGGGSGGAEGPGTTAIVQKLRGSSRDIIDPIESIMAQTYLVNRTLAHNDIIKAFVELAQRAGPEGGKYVEVIPAHEARKYTADLEQAVMNRAKDIGMSPTDAQNIISALGGPPGSPIEGSYFQMERTSARGEPIVFYREGGQLKAARFMSEPEGHALFELLTAAPEPVRDLWGDIVAAASAVKRSSIVTNPTFAITNYVRDQVAASILRSDYVPFYSGIRGIKEEFMQGNNAVLYGYAGGVSGGASVGPVEKAFKTEIDAMAKKGYAVNRLTSLKGLMELSSFTEAGTRNSIFGTVFEASKRKGLSDYDAMVEAAFQAQDLLDFSRHGSRTIHIRTYLPFLNAHLQGLDKARRTMIEPITNRIREGFVFEKDSVEFNNAVAAWMKAGALGGALGAGWAALNWDNEAYRDASPYFKGTHLVVPFGNKIITVPKPFELGMGFTAGEYAYHALVKDDPRAARMFAEAIWDTINPPNPVSDMPIITPAIELTLGKSMFTKRDIVPEQLQAKPPAQQFTDRTSELAKWLGQQTGLSPIKIDYAIGSQFATWGRDVMALSQGVSENTPAESLDDMIFFRRFVKDPTRSSDVTTRFWDFMSRTTGKFNQDVAGYNDLVREAVTRGQPMSVASDFLAKLPAAEKAFVTLKSAAKDNGQPAFTADERRLHPLQHAYDAVQVLNTLRTELAENRQMTFGSREKLPLDKQERRLLLENVRELAQMEMRNSLVIMGEGGFAGRPVLNPNDTMDKIRHLSPAVADEIAVRYATAKVYSTSTIQQSWPRLRDELVRNGSQADIRGLSFDAKAEGYQFGAQRAKRPGVIRRPIAPVPVPVPASVP